MTLTTGLQISEPTPDNLVLSPVKQSGLADRMAGLDAPICLTQDSPRLQPAVRALPVVIRSS